MEDGHLHVCFIIVQPEQSKNHSNTCQASRPMASPRAPTLSSLPCNAQSPGVPKVTTSGQHLPSWGNRRTKEVAGGASCGSYPPLNTQSTLPPPFASPARSVRRECLLLETRTRSPGDASHLLKRSRRAGCLARRRPEGKRIPLSHQPPCSFSSIVFA